MIRTPYHQHTLATGITYLYVLLTYTHTHTLSSTHPCNRHCYTLTYLRQTRLVVQLVHCYPHGQFLHFVVHDVCASVDHQPSTQIRYASYQRIRSRRSNNAPSQYMLSTHLIKIPYQLILSTHLINTLYQHTLSTHLIHTPFLTHPLNTLHASVSALPWRYLVYKFINTPYQHTFSTHPTNTPS